MAVVRPVEEFELNDFFMGVMKHISKKEASDVVTPRNPLFKRLQQNGNLETRPPSHTYTEDVVYGLPDKSIMISRDDDMKERDYSPEDVATQAHYYPVQRIDTLTIPQFQYDNNKGAQAVTDIILRKRKQTDKASRNALAGILWNGITVGSSHVFGLNEAIQFDPSAPPAAGNIGNIAQTGDNTWWQNVTHNFNKAYATVTAGGHYNATTFLEDDAHSLLQAWIDVTYLDDGDTEAGQPDLFPMNETLYKFFSALVDQKLVFNDTANKRDLGVGSTIHYRGMDCFHDRNVPNDPSDATYGVGKMINTNSFSWTYTEGLKEKWGDMQKLSRTGYAWDRKTQFSITYRNRRQNAVIYGVKPASYA